MTKTIKSGKAQNIDEYISGFPKDTQIALEEVRTTIKKSVPGLEETISYAIPAFKYGASTLVYFAGYKNHVGLYPVPTGNIEFENDFSFYKTSGKGAIQFPLSEPMPVLLITKIVKFRLQEHLKKEKTKTQKKTTNP